MGTNEITAKDLREFFTTFGIGPIDLSTSKEPGWDLREAVQKTGYQLIREGQWDAIVIENLKDKPVRYPVFQFIATRNDHEGTFGPMIDPHELRAALEMAGLLKLPQGQDTYGLWRSFESAKWALLKRSDERELADYLNHRPTDEVRRKVLDLLEEKSKRNPYGYYTDPFLPDEGLTKVMLASSDPLIRGRYLDLFAVSKSAGGFEGSTLGVFQTLEFTFRDILAGIDQRDLYTANRLLKSKEPGRVAFGLLCAKKLMKPEAFKEACRKVAERKEIADQKVYRYYAVNGCAREEFEATLGELARSLIAGKNVVTVSVPEGSCGG